MVTTNIQGKCSYCGQRAEGSGGCVRQECINARMRTAMKDSTAEPDSNSLDRAVIKNVFVKN